MTLKERIYEELLRLFAQPHRATHQCVSLSDLATDLEPFVERELDARSERDRDEDE